MLVLGIIGVIAAVGLFLGAYGAPDWETTYVLIAIGIAILILGIAFIVTHCMVMDYADGIGFVWLVAGGLIGIDILVIYFASGPFTITKLIVCAVFVFIIALVLFILMLIRRGEIVEYYEEVKQAQSEVKIAKHKYLTALRKYNEQQTQTQTQQHNNKQSNVNTHVFENNIERPYAVNAKMVKDLSDNLAYKQDRLSERVKEYNVFIRTFPNNIVAAVFGFKKEKYVDQDNLDSSVDLNGYDQNDL